MDRSFSRACRTLIGALALLTAVACSRPADKKLVTCRGLEAYRASLAPVAAKLSPEQAKALDWAVSDRNLDTLNARYPEGSVRDIVRGEARLVLETYPATLKALETRHRAEAPIRAQLSRIAALHPQFFIDRNFFGLQPRIRATVVNDSSLPISGLNWKAALYIDGRTEPEATTTLTNDYRNNGGLKPGGRFTVTFNVGFVRGDENWTTLAIRDARTRRVVLTPLLDSLKDFSDRT
ncbi:hypothetical protein [Aerolutibacter ruishenii]|uniref:Lipoprotein n=1 Tax=Aerolutibacter ruishenii TaxID=686800 RepID=A0A562LFH5_9GAMM|nr:hypothetical protein [Lysobacter ruishenii]TWI06379.1 hypothetical protein IP93_02999 [Lysobacter ruishenii]